MKFTDFNLDSRIVQSLTDNNFINPTPIQEKVIPPGLKRADIIGIAPTGTGKTFAFILPSLNWLFNAKINHNDPTILILVPTRELVKQIQKNIIIFSKNTEIFTMGIFSGERVGKQIRGLQGIIDIIIATPGRLLNFLEDNSISLNNISILILDEVDRLLDLGFKPDIETILGYLPHKNKRQTLMLGSTLPSSVEQFAYTLQKNPKLIDIGRAKSPKKIIHEVFLADEKQKFDLLLDLLHKPDIEKVLIFTRSQENARITARNLLRDGLDVEEFHGGLTQRTRNRAIANFNFGEVNVLVATDIAARGLDFEEVSHVISFDVPHNFDDYIHRAGRTGRINRKGISWVLASPEEEVFVKNIQNQLTGITKPKRKTTKRKKPVSREDKYKFKKSRTNKKSKPSRKITSRTRKRR